MGAALSIVAATALFLTVLRYSSVEDFNTPSKQICYTHNVTLLAVDNLDLRYYTGGSISIDIDTYDSYDVSVCSAQCESNGLTKSMPINFTMTVKFHDMEANNRFFAKFPSDNSSNIPSVQALKGSNFTLALKSLDNVTPVQNFKIYTFHNACKCSAFKDYRLEEAPEEEQSPPFVISPATDEASGLVCVVIELETTGNYSFTASGMAVQYETASALNNNNLCTSYSDNQQIKFETRKIDFRLPRPWSSTINPRPQRFCVLMTIDRAIDKESRRSCGSFCRVNVNTIVHGTISNIGVISFLIVATLVLMLSIILSSTCLCCFVLQSKL